MTTPQAPPGTVETKSPATKRSSRLGARRGVLGVVAAAAVASCLLALSALSSGSTAAPAKATAAPQVSLAAVQAGAADALNSLNAASASPAAAGTVRIAIQNYAFSPATVSITPGTTVVWTNEDTVPHNVHGTGPVSFTSPMLQKGDSYTYTFTTSGTYTYVCDYHPDMKASLTVAGSTTTTTVAPTTTTTAAGGPTTTMTMPTTSASGGGTCLISGILTPLITHINATHLGESPGQQVQDLLNLDQYVKTHTALIASMLNPLTNGGLVNLLSGTLTPLIVHFNATHLGESPGQQVQDLLNTDQYVKTHTALIANMLKPLEGATC
jgi:plastocyanin